MIRVQFKEDLRALLVIETRSARLAEALAAKVNALNERLRERIQAKYSGEVVNIRTGALVRSVTVEPATILATRVRGGVSAGGSLAPYAMHLEYGAAAHHIVPRKTEKVAYQRSALRFLIGHQVLYRAWVNMPTLQAREVVRGTQKEMLGQFVSEIQETVMDILSARPRSESGRFI
jgi:hypothetical protein